MCLGAHMRNKPIPSPHLPNNHPPIATNQRQSAQQPQQSTESKALTADLEPLPNKTPQLTQSSQSSNSTSSMQSNWTSTTKMGQTIVTNPGQLLANIPGLLGFYPQESIVFIAIEHKNQTTAINHPQNEPLNRQSNPIIRIDLEDIMVVPDICAFLAQLNVDYVMALIISRTYQDESHHQQQIIDILVHNFKLNHVCLQWIWHTEAIAHHNTYTLVYDRYNSLESIETEKPEWRQGLISSIAAAQTTQEMLARGELPELSRQDCINFFTNTSLLTASQHQKIYEQAADLIFAAETTPQILQQQLTSLTQTCQKLEAMMAEHPSCVGVEISSQQQELTAMFLSRTMLRDLSLSIWCGGYFQAAKALCLSVARAYNGTIRSNALCVYAMCELATTNSAKALHALQASQQTTPDHQLTLLLLKSYRAGMGKKIFHAIFQGSLATYQQCGLEPPTPISNWDLV